MFPLIPGFSVDDHETMFIRDIIPTISNYCSIISECIATQSIKSAASVHGVLIKTALSGDTFVTNRLFHVYSKCVSIDNARKMFDEIPMKNVRSWNAMVSAYAQAGDFSKALELFSRMPERDIVCCNSLISELYHRGLYRESVKLFLDLQKDWNLVVMDEYTFVVAVGSCACLGALKLVQQVHSIGLIIGLDWNRITCNALIDAYGKCRDSGASYEIFIQMSDVERDVVSWTSVVVACAHAHRLDDAYEVFDSMPLRNTVSWTAMITGYARNGRGDEALDLFRQMNEEGVIPSSVTFVSVLGPCADMALIERGKQVHGHIIRTISNTDVLNVYVSNALVDMYCKCGDMKSAEVIFQEMPCKDIVSWNSMITGYSQNGFGHKALSLLSEMIEKNVRPNHVTFLSVLSACSHSGLGNEALDVVDLMVNHHKAVLTSDHFAVLIDTLGRRNRLKEAIDLIERCPDKSYHVGMWGSILASSRVHGNIEIARRAADALLELEPWNAGRYVMMSNTYAAANKWDDAEEARMQLAERALVKDAGNSSIEVKNVTHNFLAKDRSPDQVEDIYELVKSLTNHMKEAGDIFQEKIAIIATDSGGYVKVPRWDENMKQKVLDCADQNRSSDNSRKEIMVEGEFNFWVPGNMLYRHERSEDTRLDDTFPLLSSDRGYNHLSPKSRLQRIEEGRKELMEMICDMPESRYELSLKDIVVEQQRGAEGPTTCPAGTETEVNNKQRENKKKRRMKDASARPGQVTRTGSMEAGSFLIRMFLPSFLMSSKKPMSGYRSKTPLSSPRASLDWSDRREMSKDLKVGRWPFPREEWSHEGTSRSKSCTSRIENSGFLSGCWPFGGSKNSKGKVMKGKMIRQKTCIF